METAQMSKPIKNALAPHPYKKTDIQIHVTSDYSMFAFAKGNRNVSPVHLTRLIESMRQNYLFTIILVNNNFEIIDGQHRLEACKILGFPVNFTIVPDYGLKEMQILNLNTSNWNHADYLAGYIGLGKQDYIDYKRFKTRYKFGHAENVYLLSGSELGVRKGATTSFNQGNFKIFNYQEACRIAEKIWMIEPHFRHFKSRGFVMIITKLIRENSKFKIDDFIKRCEANPSFLKKCATTDQYLDMIEYIYNYRRQEKIGLKY